MKTFILSIGIMVCSQLFNISAFAGGSIEKFIFESTDKSIKLVYSRAAEIAIDVYAKDKLVFSTSFSEDNGPPEVKFIDINGDSVQDIIVRLEDESGFEPVFILSKPNSGQFTQALANKSLTVDYTNLETNIPGKLHNPYEIEESRNGSKILVFHHLYIGRSLQHQVKLVLNQQKTDFQIQY